MKCAGCPRSCSGGPSYALIGVTFAFVTWFFVSALVIIAAGVIVPRQATGRPGCDQ
jgi:hypothetical protein